MKKFNLLIIIIFLLSNINPLQAAHLSESLLITAKLTGSQQVPPVTTKTSNRLWQEEEP